MRALASEADAPPTAVGGEQVDRALVGDVAPSEEAVHDLREGRPYRHAPELIACRLEVAAGLVQEVRVVFGLRGLHRLHELTARIGGVVDVSERRAAEKHLAHAALRIVRGAVAVDGAGKAVGAHPCKVHVGELLAVREGAHQVVRRADPRLGGGGFGQGG